MSAGHARVTQILWMRGERIRHFLLILHFKNMFLTLPSLCEHFQIRVFKGTLAAIFALSSYSLLTYLFM